MLNKFYVKFSLFCILLLLCVLIIDTKSKTVNLPIFVRDEVKLTKETTKESEYLIYVADVNDLIFPINIVTTKKLDFNMTYYQKKINNSLDDTIYMTFSLLTNYSNYLPSGVKTLIPTSTQLLDYEINGDILTLNLSKAFLNYSQKSEKEMLEIITYTYTNLLDIKSVKLLCENERINFNNYEQNIFKQNNFLLNVFLKTTDVNNAELYIVYFFTNIKDTYYLVPTTIIKSQDNLSHEQNVVNLLSNTLNIPLISFFDNNHDDDQNDDFSESFANYQYFLTCFENNIMNRNFSIDIKNINFYDIEFK